MPRLKGKCYLCGCSTDDRFCDKCATYYSHWVYYGHKGSNQYD